VVCGGTVVDGKGDFGGSGMKKGGVTATIAALFGGLGQ